jgi:hypothetical protein
MPFDGACELDRICQGFLDKTGLDDRSGDDAGAAAAPLPSAPFGGPEHSSQRASVPEAPRTTPPCDAHRETADAAQPDGQVDEPNCAQPAAPEAAGAASSTAMTAQRQTRPAGRPQALDEATRTEPVDEAAAQGAASVSRPQATDPQEAAGSADVKQRGEIDNPDADGTVPAGILRNSFDGRGIQWRAPP